MSLQAADIYETSQDQLFPHDYLRAAQLTNAVCEQGLLADNRIRGSNPTALSELTLNDWRAD